jgi:hypothetical protein
VKKYICHLGCNKFDTQIAVVENSGKNEEMEDTAIRIYDVGRSKDEDDEAVSNVFQRVYGCRFVISTFSNNGTFVGRRGGGRR